MAYVITQNCCKDASCVPVCPVDCIRPADGDDGTEMLYIDPETCIDCGACMEECPVDAIYYEDDLPEQLSRYADINARYFEHHPLEPATVSAARSHAAVSAGALRVAIVGAGAAACYAAAELTAVDGVEVNVFERLPTPFGLIRSGVAPDHQHTKRVVGVFEHAFTSDRMRCYLNVEVGSTIHHDELLAHHHAVIYAVGAKEGRTLGIPGDRLPGVHAAADFVGWYNGHPDRAADTFDLSGPRVVIVGNGNVALDVARVLLMDRDAASTTDVADHALESLSASGVEEVVIVARRGIRDAAFSVGEFMALGNMPGIDVVIEADDLATNPDDDFESALKVEIAREYAHRGFTDGHKRVVFKFGRPPAEVVGGGRAEGLRAGDELISAGVILASIGYRAPAIAGLPHDDERGVVPNQNGRVDAGVYVTGWVKRGPHGVIGTNRGCAEETVAQLFADFDAGVLDREIATVEGLGELLAQRGSRPLSWPQWRAIDAVERQRGAEMSRPRVKLVTLADMLAAAVS